MQSIHEVLFGEGDQTLYFCATDKQGRGRRVSSATVSIVDLRSSENSSRRVVLAETAATIANTSAELQAEAGPSTAYGNRLTVDDTTGFLVGHRYALTATSGHEEIVRISAVDAANNRIHTDQPVKGSYLVGSTLSACELTCTFPASVANDENRTVDDYAGTFQVVWEFTLDGVLHRVPELCRVKRYSTQPWTSVEKVLRYRSDLSQIESRRITDAISVASDRIASELLAAGRDPAYYRQSLQGQMAATLCALDLIFSAIPGDEHREDARSYRGEWKGLLLNMLNYQAPKETVYVSESTDQVSPGEEDTDSTWVVG